MIMSSRSRMSNLLFSNSCINWLKATLATPGLLATTRNASLCVRRAGIPIASPSSRARSSDTIGTREVIVTPLLSFLLTCYRASRPRATPRPPGLAILVTRGNEGTPTKAEDPGALKVFEYKNGVLTNEVSVAPDGGKEFGPRHLDFHPTKPWIYVSIETQNKMYT